ncbi:hypothetical protein FC51_GL001250 [Lentilactobacillus parabuchneri DSM 5707 = NBRC 107865]|uniref:Uncharacterized protein n=2 Tax=Lentilactobacillus parabuchneri TaxID=152331 RepID=A0A0R1YZQ2_9LACO|nr:hypothetical protein FC51_GL001250 [Lentilactobacillus parabuchneri DSM 5707 = NBRC 107865]
MRDMENENNKLDRKRLSEIVPALTTVISDPDDQFSLFDWGHGEIIGLIHHYEDDPDTEVEDVLSGGVKGGLGYSYDPVDEAHFQVDGKDKTLIKGTVASRSVAVLVSPDVPEAILDYLSIDMINTLQIPGIHYEYPDVLD